MSALQAGDNPGARALFEQVIASGQAGSPHWLGLAHALQRLGEFRAALDALDKSLELEPHNVRAVLFKADFLAGRSQPRQALEYYQYAVKLTAGASGIPADIQRGLARAQQAIAAQAGEYRDFLLNRLSTEGFSPGAGRSRFQQSLELIFDNKQIYYQEPRRYYYPGLPQVQFYEREQFDWVEGMEARTDEIREELRAVLDDPSRFSPYIKADETHLGAENEGLADNERWSALFLWDYGRLVEENAPLFPATLEALEGAPLPFISGQAPMALFSRLSAATRIPPHNGLLNTRLICHLPLVVPENCGALRVGNEERAWQEGRMLLFDDSIEHEAWNDSDSTRVILLFEVWRPEIGDEERHLVATMLQAVRDYHENSAT